MLTCLGISIGFHRLFTHRAYETYPIRYGLAVLGLMAVQGPVIRWVLTTASTTTSPIGRATAFAARRLRPGAGRPAGLWHAHVGWLFRNVGRAEWTKYARTCSPTAAWPVSRWFGLWVALARAAVRGHWLWGGRPRRRRCSGAA